MTASPEGATFRLQRFVHAQRETYADALAELRAGTKRSHWMWFVFPQLAGLGHSPTARYFAISGLGEAQDYLAHPVLGPRLAECTDRMLDWAGKRSAVAILGEIDALKFRSAMTLFELAALDRIERDRFSHALDAFCQGRRDERTLRLLRPARGAAN
ncbi:Uncharacterized protein, DUF1810 family [Novosphingobium sp. CF614]|uniref:DUF1810 domain-containing protein n=1 Tax=Novosphingobium sp. CF614 TaxID=1884364 RepID=UPI0008F44E2A|nr:DUF1810 domain-containing protein [Novosphingobium sp. CF614]SFG15693.1 Uncharacterized protein, DUF1810 family [Novosphingobium sp. CF614]